ncbi:MAG: response regulator [bacterium]
MAKRILLVGDDRDILDLLRYNLEAEGYETMTATDGPGALELAQNRPDLIIIELILPGKNGWEIIRQIREKDPAGHISVIFLTAKGKKLDDLTGPNLDAEELIAKPFSIRKLLTRVNAVLEKN